MCDEKKRCAVCNKELFEEDGLYHRDTNELHCMGCAAKEDEAVAEFLESASLGTAAKRALFSMREMLRIADEGGEEGEAPLDMGLFGAILLDWARTVEKRLQEALKEST